MNNDTFEIIVTGATGFVGRVLVKKLAKLYPRKKILCLVYSKDNNLEISGRKILDDLKVKYIKVDLTKKINTKSLPKKPKLIIHLAAETDTAKRDHKINSYGTKNLFNTFKNIDKTTHFIHIGTMVEVVGRPKCSDPVDENSNDYPTNEYTRTKLEGEKFIVRMCKNNKFKLTVIRPNTIYGRGVRKNSLFDMITNIVKKGSFLSRINWPGKSALIHVDDLTDIIVRFCKNPPTPGKPQKFLIYSENLSIFEISKTVHKKLGIKFRPILIPDSIWNLIKKMRKFIPYFESILPYSLYNYLWRFGIIIDNTISCGSTKIFTKFKDFHPIKFSSGVDDVI
jgi:nucleoside-diphosphate-sugar epimerase